MNLCLHLKDPVSRDREILTFAAGQTLNDLAPDWGVPYVALRNTEAVLRAGWDAPLAEGDIVAFVALPQGPLIPLIAAWAAEYVAAELVVAAWTAGMITTGAAYLGAYYAIYAVTLVGATMLLNAAVGTPSNPSNLGGQTTASPTYSLTSASNSARVNQPIPVQYGRMKIFPDFCCQPYGNYVTTSNPDGDMYLTQTLMLGQGEYDIEAVLIDDTPITQFGDVTYGILPPGEAAPAQVSQFMLQTPEVSGNTLDTDAPLTYTVVPEGRTATALEIDLVCPRGLAYQNTDASLSELAVIVRVETRTVSDAAWTPVGGIAYGPWGGWVIVANGAPPANTDVNEYRVGSCSQWDENGWYCLQYSYDQRTRTRYDNAIGIIAASTTAQRRTFVFTVPAGRYEMRLTRIDAKNTSNQAQHEVQWSAARAVLDAPVGFDPAYGQTTRLWLVMRASEQLSQNSARKVGVIATRKLPVWDGTTWSAPQTTRSPAWALADILKAPYGGKLADSQINLASLLALDAEWAARGDTLNCVFDGRITVWEAVAKAARSLRTRPYLQAGRVSFARDRLDTQPVALFSPANMLKDTFTLQYLMPSEQTAEELRVRYFSEITWKQAEEIYTLPSADPDRFAEVDLFGVTSAAQAQREARYMALTNRHRRRVVSFDVELESMILSPLDTILISHDLPDWGQWASVEKWDAASLTLTVSPPLTWTDGQTHYLRMRDRGGRPTEVIAATRGDSDAEIRMPDNLTPQPDDLFSDREPTHIAFGPGVAWQVRAKVLAIRPKDQYTASISAVVEDDRVHEDA